MISETKIHETFSVAQFCIDGYSKPYHFGGNSNGAGILVYVRCKRSLPSKMIKADIQDTFEGFFIEINFNPLSTNPTKWLKKKNFLVATISPIKPTSLPMENA